MGNELSRSGMYLRSLGVKNFRSCKDTSVELRPDITLLVGENNSGKSNLIEAIRLCTSPLNPRSTRWFDQSDRSHGSEESEVEFTTIFDGLTAIQCAHYTTALNVLTNQAHYKTVYPVVQSGRRARPVFTAGPFDGPDGEPEKREQIAHVYLAPLRDARRELDSADNGRLLRVIEQLTTDDEQKSLVEDVNEVFAGLAAHPVLTTTTGAIQEHLDDMTLSVRGQKVNVTFQDYELARLTRGLRVKMAEHGVSPADLAESGLGYANLLFIATVILELRNAKDAELTLFLVEEPEAHLHPQLQAVLLDYLQEQATSSVKDDSVGPAGRIQVIATTHSANLASSVDIQNVVVLRAGDTQIDIEEGRSGAAERPLHRWTRALPLANAKLDTHDFRKINQYLDATRAGILFARRVLLVEGIAEAVLLPVIARHCVLVGDEENQQRLRRAFHSVTIVNVGSVDFAPYISLLLGDINGSRLLDHLVVITDADPPLPPDPDTSPDHTTDLQIPPPRPAAGPGTDGAHEDITAEEHESGDVGETESANRRDRLLEHAKSLGAAGHLFVGEAPHTLEADLLTPDGNETVLRGAYLKQHPKSAKAWNSITSDSDPTVAFYRKLCTNKKFISKGEFAHDVAITIEEGHPFTAPLYLREAILSVLGELSGVAHDNAAH
ncbi:AAA family ATPase [Actinoallomurus sp. NBC_01490]|uniref:ATP-dependent nuclease n=1 Tax=Actinoallomurus sp. NBC_01490 TaxID=2903557 RepID=UPI002E301653|nr:AAA family ATPase [Actinoallomurus sp. NBC_01490]